MPAEVNERINRRGSIEQLRIVGVSLANAVQYGEALISTVENADYERTGATELESKESIDQLRTVAGVDVVAHLREVPQGTKGSLRSETVDVGEIARHFGGGRPQARRRLHHAAPTRTRPGKSFWECSKASWISGAGDNGEGPYRAAFCWTSRRA